MHGGASTGPRTPEGRRRVGDAARARYVSAAIAEGWVVISARLRAAVTSLVAANGGRINPVARELGISRHGVRRVLARLPSRPDEGSILELRFGRGK